MSEPIVRILVPVDFSSHSDMAVRYAAKLARRLGASVELLHVVEDPFAAGKWGAGDPASDVPELLDVTLIDARHRMDALKVAAAREHMPIQGAVVMGHPARSIVEHAKAAGSHLIVIGIRGRSSQPDDELGVVAEQVLRTAPCPVLTVREIATSSSGESSTAAVAGA